MRRASDAEGRACRLLLPEVFGPVYAPDLWVAIDSDTDLLVGAAAVAWRPVAEPPGFPVSVHVLEPLRRRGIGSALVEAIARACAGDARRLQSAMSFEDNSPVIPFLRATGFSASRRMLEYQADVVTFYAAVKDLRDRLARKIPDSFRIVSLSQAPADEVALLVAQNFREASGAALAGVARGLGGQDPDKSVILLDGNTVRGALLYSWNDGDPIIDARIVSPEVRGSAANLLMLETATRNGLEAGAKRFRFGCTDDNRDTIKLAARAGATLLSTKSIFTRDLPG